MRSKYSHILAILAAAFGLLLAGCSSQTAPTSPAAAALAQSEASAPGAQNQQQVGQAEVLLQQQASHKEMTGAKANGQ
jgi:putative hemolysin